MQKYQYKLSNSDVGFTEEGTREKTEEMMNELAKDGWEYYDSFFYSNTNSSGLCLVFRREAE